MSRQFARRLFWISGLAVLLLLVVLFQDSADKTAARATAKGNSLYAAGQYAEALQQYSIGLAVDPNNQTLHFNAAQAAYRLDEKAIAIEHYARSENSVNKFLNEGNANCWLGNAGSNFAQQTEYYERALQNYADGMVVYPQNMQLKYNYELVQQMLNQVLQEQQTESAQNPPAAGDGSQEVMSQGKQGREGSGTSKEENQEAQGGDPDHSGQDQEKDPGDASKADDEDGGGKDHGENDGQNDSQGLGQENKEAEMETLLRIMRIVEGQEEENLKNNQGALEEENESYGLW